MDSIVANLLPVLTLITPAATVLLTVRYLNLRDARRDPTTITVDDGVGSEGYRV